MSDPDDRDALDYERRCFEEERDPEYLDWLDYVDAEREEEE